MIREQLSRRGFLGRAAAVSGAMLLPAGLAAEGLPSDSPSLAVADKVAARARPFPLQQVRLLPSRWKDMMELNRSFLYSLPNDRLAHNFRVEAGIASDATPLGGWEAPDCELRGHYVGHYLSACALMYATTGDDALRQKANTLVTMLVECQSKDGYLSAYPVSFYERLKSHKPVWAPFYTYHKVLAGMMDMYQHAGNGQALTVAKRMADWADEFSAAIDPGEWQKVLLVEQGGMNEAAFNLYAITGETRYRDLAYRFEHRKFFDPLAAGEDKLSGNHANTNIPKVIGAARGYELTGDERYRTISENFYRQVVEHHSYCTGGTSNGEGWQEPDAISKNLGGSAQECCCSYNMMKLGRHLFAREPQAAYFDHYERTLFNMRRGTQDRNGMLMYYVSLRPGLYKSFGTPFDAFWCCTGTGSEEYAKLTDSIYFQSDDALYVNLFVSSRLDWKERNLTLRQTTKFPNEERVRLTFESTPTSAVKLKIRVPYWLSGGSAAGLNLLVNGASQRAAPDAAGYAVVERSWKAGDVVEIDLPMALHIAPANDDKHIQAAMYGPLVLAVVMGTEDLTTSMIYHGFIPDQSGMPMPEVQQEGIWFERTEADAKYSLRFRSKGKGVIHTLAPLNEVMDERYSVYVRNTAVTA
jgi:DUF1680 family protein